MKIELKLKRFVFIIPILVKFYLTEGHENSSYWSISKMTLATPFLKRLMVDKMRLLAGTNN